MKKYAGKIISVIALAAIAFLYYYVTLPAINIHATGFWLFVIVLAALLTGLYGVVKIKDVKLMRKSKGVKAGVIVIGVLVLIFAVGTLLSSPIINAKKYQKLLTVEERNFTEDIKQVSYDQIPILDKDSAELLGNRKMGSMVDMVSQFEVSNLYTQINVNGEPVRVTPLVYANPVKWFTNRSEGVPAYMRIDMATQNVDCVKLDSGIKYSESEYFGRNVYRHLRFRYPTYIFDTLNFEIDDEGVPYWICPVKKFTIGLFGGQVVGDVVLLNAITGETKNYAVEDVPRWVDKVYSPELLVSLYNYYGSLQHGYFNSILGQKGCLKTTDGYNYIALDDDVWVYTGITSVSGDSSNVGFILMNQRTKETRYYKVPGAEEFSAMSSAEGQVQNLGYKATFPLLLNIANEPTYFIALKDDAGLVKKYAMVNIEKYQVVAIGDSVIDCEKSYVTLLKSSGISKEEETTSTIQEKTGVIRKIAQGVVEGNSHYYIMLEGSEDIYDVSVAKFIDIVKYEVGNTVTLEFSDGEKAKTVLSIK